LDKEHAGILKKIAMVLNLSDFNDKRLYTGCGLRVVGCGLQVAGYWLLDAPLSAGFPLRYNWLWMLDADHWLLDAGYWLLITDNR
jgi:hypothetical protein